MSSHSEIDGTTLLTYLESKRTSGADWNLTGLDGAWKGKFKVPDAGADAEYDDFLYLLYNHMFVLKLSCNLVERQLKCGPLLTDLDFRYEAGGPLDRRFTDDHLRKFVAAYADAFAYFFAPVMDADNSSVPLEFFVMTKPGPEKDGQKHKDGVHIICPTISVPHELQCAIRGFLLQTKVIERIFGQTGMINSAADCLDLSVIRPTNPCNWFPYGACKPNKARYSLVAVYSVEVPEDIEEIEPDTLNSLSLDSWTDNELVNLLSVRRGHEVPTALTLRDGPTRIEWNALMDKWGNGKEQAKPRVQRPEETVAATDASGCTEFGANSVRAEHSAEDLLLAKALIEECLDPEKRCGEYQDWARTALCLKNIKNTDEFFQSWADLTRRTDASHKKSRMSDTELRAKWNSFPAGEDAASRKGRKPLMMGTLHHWAREDNLTAYRAIMAKTNTTMAMTNDTGTHVSIANLFVRMYGNEFRCVPPKRGATAAQMDWYQYEGHAWRELKTNTMLRARLDTEVRNVFLQVDADLIRKIQCSTDNDEKERLNKKRERIYKIEQNLQTTKFKDSVMREITEKFYDENFLPLMNMDPTLVGFSNGVLELRHVEGEGDDAEEHVHFRPGRPDDCISFQMGRGVAGAEAIPYLPYDPEHPEPAHVEILNFFQKIYPNPEVLKYNLTLRAACLEGANKEQCFYIMMGCGSNGKSMIISLDSMTFGEYAESLPATSLTRKSADGGSANPELVVLRCKRYISTTEPEADEKLNTSLMKKLSGEDTVKVRGLFKDQDQFVIMGRIFMACNDLPNVSSTDGGTWRRLMVIPHISRFVPAGQPTDPSKYIFSRDEKLSSKLKQWRPYYAGILVWYFENHLLRTGLIPPADVRRESDKYKEDMDSFIGFATECLTREVGAEVKLRDVMERYKEFNKYVPAGKKVLSKKDIEARMIEMYGRAVGANKMFAGVRIVDEDDAAAAPAACEIRSN